MKTEFAALSDLYRSLTERLPHFEGSGNVCGTCRACCTGRGLSVQNVAEIEFAAIQAHYGEDRTDDFRDYVERKRDVMGTMMHEVCPFYDTENSACGIYEHRPYSCRVFGHFRMAGTRLPDGCVYEGHVQEVDQGAYFRMVPMARELRDLQRAWEARRPQPRQNVEMTDDLLEKVRRNVDPEDPVDMAMLAQLEGRRDDALALLDRALAERPDDASLHLSRGNILDELQRPSEAQVAYERAVAIDADNPRAWIHLGFTRVEQGDAVGARDAFGAAVRLQPDDPTSRGFLGWLSMATAATMDEIRGGGDHLAEAVRLDPSNALFQLRLAECLLAQGRAADALPHLHAAASDPRIAPAAAKARERFSHLGI